MGNGAKPPSTSTLLHGAVWRATSLAARLAFLVFVVPRTAPGEFGLFFSYSSLGLLLARVISIGAVDHLPTRIRGDTQAMRQACRDFAPLYIVACAATGVAMLVSSLVVSAFAVGLSMASGLALGGAVRSVTPAWFERWMNLHPILLLVMALALGDMWRAPELMMLQAVAVLVSQLPLLRFAFVRSAPFANASRVSWAARVRGLMAGGPARMVSDVLVTACLRGVAVGPVLLGVGAISDSLALALALGEAIWTVGMVLVHRNFAFYCASGPDLAHSLRSAMILLVAVSAAGAVGAAIALTFGDLAVLDRVEPFSLFASFVFFSGVTALYELRYFDLAMSRPLSPWISAQAAFALLAAAAPVLVGESVAIWLIAAATFLSSLGIMSRRYQLAKLAL